MCGIAGELRLVSVSAPAPTACVPCDVMVHRGPDDEGLLAHAEVALGMRRLSIVDVSGGQQRSPTRMARCRWCARRDLQQRSAALRARSSGASLPQPLGRRGDRPPLRGGGCGRESAGWRACSPSRSGMRGGPPPPRRDRFGIKPLYLAETPRRDPLRLRGEVSPRGRPRPVIDPQALHDYLSSATCGPDSIFAGARQLPAAHLMVASRATAAGGSRVERYWSSPGMPRRASGGARRSGRRSCLARSGRRSRAT